jgi:peptidoglycan-N-acetylglucosamine deacetylase
VTLGLLKSVVRRMLNPLILTRGSANGIHLTFDDGPHPDHTRPILEALQRQNAKATFFMIGSEMERYPDLVGEVLARGHTIGFHSYAHRHPKDLSVDQSVADLRQSRDVAKRFGLRFRYYRPPYGELSFAQILWCAWNGVRVVLWSRESRDSFVIQPEELVMWIDGLRTRDGDILLFHDDTSVTAVALPVVLERLSARGVQFLALEA